MEKIFRLEVTFTFEKLPTVELIKMMLDGDVGRLKNAGPYLSV